MSNEVYEFGPFRFDAIKQTLTRDGEPVRLRAKASELLKVLLEHSGEVLDKETLQSGGVQTLQSGGVLDKETLMTRLWPDTVVEENNLTVHMTALRKALGDRADEPRYIATIPGRGYRFIAEVRVPQAELPAVQAIEQVATNETATESATPPAQEPAQEQENVKVWLQGRRRITSRGWIVLAVLVIALVGVAVYWWRAKPRSIQQTQAALPPPVKSLAVLPFKLLTPQSGQDYLGVGIADVMITRLSNLRQLVVRPTSSVLPFSTQDILQAGQALNVDLVLEGNIQKQGDRARITVNLLRVSDNQTLMAFQCDEKCTDMFALQDAISNQVTEALALQLTGDERQRLTKSYTANAEAFQEYFKGRYYTLQYTPEGFKQAVEHLNNAIRLDPTYALAYAGLADAYTAASDWLLPPREALTNARAAAEKALSLDDTLAEAHAARGHVQLHRLEPEAERELQRALELNPNSVTAMLWYGEYFMAKDLAKGLEVLHQAQRLDPLSPIIASFITASYLLARQPNETMIAAQKAIALDANDAFARGLLAEAYDALGKYTESMAETDKLRKSFINPQQLGTLGRDYALTGKPEAARRILAEMDQLEKTQYVSPYDRAVIYVALGDKDQAFAWLDKAYENQSEWMGWLQVDYRLDALHGDPRFDSLLHRAGLSS